MLERAREEAARRLQVAEEQAHAAQQEGEEHLRELDANTAGSSKPREGSPRARTARKDGERDGERAACPRTGGAGDEQAAGAKGLRAAQLIHAGRREEQ